MANPWAGCSLSTASTVHSASDNDGQALMSPSLDDHSRCYLGEIPPVKTGASHGPPGTTRS